MSHSTTTTITQGRFWSGLAAIRPSGKQTIIGSAVMLAVSVAVFLTWLFAWSGGGSSLNLQLGGGFDGGSGALIAPSPAGVPDSFFGSQGLSVTVSDEAFREENFGKAFAGGSATPTAANSSSGEAAFSGRQVISQGSMSVEVVNVASASAQVRAIAELAGGFVEQLSSYGVDEFRQSTMTVRVPQAEFFSVFEQIKALGKVQNENAGTEDVTERFIDLEARLKSAQREELSLLSLLDRADDISEILIIERELSRVRTELEQVQGQLNFLERRVDLATITVSLGHPQRDDGQAPYGSFSIDASNVDSSVTAIKTLVSQLNGEVDQVYTTVHEDLQRANMTVRVFADDFNLVVAAVEGQGGLISKEIREGLKGDPVLADSDDEEPNARLDIVFSQEESSNLGRNLAIFIPIGSVSLVIVLGLLLYGSYRLGLRKED